MFVQSWFLKILNMSLTSSVVILVVLLVRAFLRKAPRICSYMLWGVVLFRLLCPVTLNAPFGVITDKTEVTALSPTTPTVERYPLEAEEIASNPSLPAFSDENLPDATEPGALSEQSIPLSLSGSEKLWGAPPADSSFWNTLTQTIAYVWLIGVIILTAVSFIQYADLRRKLVGAVILKDNIYRADHISSPFVLGVICPKIYLPSSLDKKEMGYVLAHEKHHISRGDPFFRMLAYISLLIHWFNPFVWIAFFASRKDMEISCDEAVLNRMGDGIRAQYSDSLLKFATGNKLPSGTPLAFGEDDTKDRIKRVIKYKRPALWVTLLAVFLCFGTIFVLAFNGSGGDESALDPSTDNPESTPEDVSHEASEVYSGQPDETILTDPGSDDMPAELIYSWHADLDNDGTDEIIYLNVSEIVPGAAAIPWIESADGARICDLPEIGLSHMGWGTYALMERDGRTFLFSYSNYVSTGAGAINYTIYTLENGALKVTEQKEFKSYMLEGTGIVTNDTDSMIAAAEQVNELWSHSRLLFSTAEDLYGLYDENGQPIEPSSIMYFGEDRIIRYREEYGYIKKALDERGLYDESMPLREILETFNELCLGTYDRMFISDFIRTVKDKNVDRYISLFASNIQAEMNDFIENNGKENFFQEESRTLLSVAAVNSDYVDSHVKSFDDVYAYFDEISVYYVTEDVQFPENAGSGLRRSGEQTNLYILVTEDGQRKLYRILGTPELDAADLGLRF